MSSPVYCWDEETQQNHHTRTRPNRLVVSMWDKEGFETTLLKELSDTTRIYTTYEPVYDRPVFTTFLTNVGYRPVEKAAFVKEVL
jgi:hypothetical protein